MHTKSEASREPWTPPPAELRSDDSWTPPTLPGLEFPGCTPRRMSYADLEAFEGHLEYWDARAETAWVCDVSGYVAHTRPSSALVARATHIDMVRGSHITGCGKMAMMLRDSGGEPRGILQADQTLYLRPLSAVLPDWEVMVVGEHDFPDVVLEVDYTTDARAGKLKLYEAWGYPEVWIHVPTDPSPSPPKDLLPGLTIHLLEDGAYRESAESWAFPGWTAEEIHTALDELVPSEETYRVLERVGLTLGAREGTWPDDDTLMISLLRRARQQSYELGPALVGQREFLRHLAERKFGAAAAAEFARRLETENDLIRLTGIGLRIFDCATVDELLE